LICLNNHLILFKPLKNRPRLLSSFSTKIIIFQFKIAHKEGLYSELNKLIEKINKLMTHSLKRANNRNKTLNNSDKILNKPQMHLFKLEKKFS